MSKVLIFGATPFSLINFRGDLLKKLTKEGHTVYGLSGIDKGFDKSKFQEFGVEHHHVFLKRTSINLFVELYSLLVVFLKIKELKPDKIFSYSIKPVIYGALSCRLLGIKNQYSLISGVGYLFTSNDKNSSSLFFKLIKFIYKHALRTSKTIFFQNDDDIKLFRKLGLITPECNVKRLYGSGVNLSKFQFKALQNEQVTFLMVARLLKDKGVWEYFLAAKKVKSVYPKTKFILVGDIDENPSTLTYDDLKKIQDADFIEHIRHSENIRELIGVSSICVLPSYREGTPRFLLEALSVGRPIITTDTAGCRDTVIDGWNGFLVPVGSIEELADAFKVCVSNSNSLKRFGRNSRKLAEKYFNVDKVNEEILSEMNL